MENMFGFFGITKPPVFSFRCRQLTAGRERELRGGKLNEILRPWQRESGGNFRGGRKKTIKQYQNKRRNKRSGFNIAEQEEKIQLGKNMKSSDSFRSQGCRLRDTVYLSYAAVCSVSWHSSETILSLCSALNTQQDLDISVGVCPPSGQGTPRPENKAGLPAENKCTFILHSADTSVWSRPQWTSRQRFAPTLLNKGEELKPVTSSDQLYNKATGPFEISWF